MIGRIDKKGPVFEIGSSKEAREEEISRRPPVTGAVEHSHSNLWKTSCAVGHLDAVLLKVYLHFSSCSGLAPPQPVLVAMDA